MANYVGIYCGNNVFILASLSCLLVHSKIFWVCQSHVGYWWGFAG